MLTSLHAQQDDWSLNAVSDTKRSTGTIFTTYYYLTDPQGNRLTDPQGNYLIGMVTTTVYPQILNANQDTFSLHAE